MINNPELIEETINNIKKIKKEELESVIEEMKLEEAKEGLKRFCEYEDSIVLTDNALYEIQELIETVLEELDNSISKDKIKEKIKQCENRRFSDFTNEPNFAVERVLKELLEDK